MDSVQRLRGTIRTLGPGYGFIVAPGHKDHFFHKSNLSAGKAAFAGLAEGQPVEFTPSVDPQHPGPRADAVAVIVAAATA